MVRAIRGELDEHVMDFDDPAEFVRGLLSEVDRADLVRQLRAYPGRSTQVATELLAAVQALGGTVETQGSTAVPSDFGRAGFLLPGTRIHMRLRSTLWQSFVTLVPVVAAAVATGGLALALLSAAPVLGIVTANSAKLTDNEKLVYVALVTLSRTRDGGVRADDVHAAVPKDSQGDQWSPGAFEATVNRLVGMRAVDDTEGGLRPVL